MGMNHDSMWVVKNTCSDASIGPKRADHDPTSKFDAGYLILGAPFAVFDSLGIT
ncbi:hypothetical protein RSSM_05562 [Rhodopirellula sallentina SM41]|uniref:Uncharacterized protein n=1 Tax=Rhodopirellula sallentina SM41 TaxID=1263870 RepID=M5UAG8_9BACT|nr:hypothetical protein RSSM_05562 [Rhodopirellula sallentina SM41]